MKACDYCGKDNDDALAFCAECGTAFGPPLCADEPPAVHSPATSRTLNGGLATAILGIYLAAQIAGGVIITVIAIIFTGIGRGPDYESTVTSLQDIMPATVLATFIAGGVAVVLVAKAFGLPLKDASPTGPAWIRGSSRAIIQGFGMGILVAIAAVFIANLMPNYFSEEELGPVARMGTTPGLGQIAWVIMALLLSPPVEELLFRGIIYAGYRKSLGPLVAASLTTAIFVLMHVTELIHNPFATFGITTLAVTTLWWRLRNAAIGPAIAVHFGYNAVVVATVLYLT
jgi:membrane protease YdiL (CAAX protease family)